MNTAQSVADIPEARWETLVIGSAISLKVGHCRAPYISVRAPKAQTREDSVIQKRRGAMALLRWLNHGDPLPWIARRVGPDQCETACGLLFVAMAPRVMVPDSRETYPDNSADAKIDNGLLIEAIVQGRRSVLPTWGKKAVIRA